MRQKSPEGSGILPSPMRFINLVIDFRKFSSALPFELLTRSLKNRGTILSGPAADPLGKDIIALYRSNSVTKNIKTFWILRCKFGSLRVLRQHFLIVIS